MATQQQQQQQQQPHQGRFTVFSDENNVAQAKSDLLQQQQQQQQLAAGARGRRAPLGVLSDANAGGHHPQRNERIGGGGGANALPPLKSRDNSVVTTAASATTTTTAAASTVSSGTRSSASHHVMVSNGSGVGAGGGGLSGKPAPLCDENCAASNVLVGKPKSSAIENNNKENQHQHAAPAAAAVRPKPARLEPAAAGREPLKVLDESMVVSPMPLGSPMVVSPMPDTPKPSGQTAKDRRHSERLLDDQFFTREYGESHYAYLRDLEMRLKPRPDYMTRQRDISSTMRSVLIDWLVEVNEEYKMSDETLFLAVSLIDRFLSVMSVVRGKLQLVGTAAMFIASKVEEIYPPQLSEFVYITDDTYSSAQIIRMEALLLKTLGFSLGGAHPLAFLRRFAIEADVSVKVAHMAQYICELSLLSTSSLAFRPSELGAAALVLAMHHVDHSTAEWNEDMHEFAGIDAGQLQGAIDQLHELLTASVSSTHKAIPEKYAHQKFSSVSLLPLLPRAPRII